MSLLSSCCLVVTPVFFVTLLRHAHGEFDQCGFGFKAVEKTFVRSVGVCVDELFWVIHTTVFRGGRVSFHKCFIPLIRYYANLAS
jgi:hypothetical protein